MKYILLLVVLFSTLNADMKQSSVKIPYNICLKYPYAHTIGGTIHSRNVQKRKLYKYALKKVHYTVEEALNIIQKNYSALNIQEIEIKVKSCFVYFQSIKAKDNYYFDAGTLELIQTKDQL